MADFNIKAYYRNLARTFSSGPTVPHRIANKTAGPGQYTGTPVGTANAYLHSSVNAYASHMAKYGDSGRLARLSSYNDMESMAEIASALDIYCLAGDNIIPLLNGQKKTITELFNSGSTNFHVYSYDIDKRKMVPGLCKKVMKTGFNQEIFKVVLDDGLQIKLTANHLVLLKTGTYRKVKELCVGDSIESLYTKQSNTDSGDRIDDYEMVFQDTKQWEYTHRLIAEHIDPTAKGVVHHRDFCKWNNEPSNLQRMTWEAHKNLHAKSNTERWQNNPRYAQKMARIFSAHAKKMWADPQWREWKKQHHSAAMHEHYKNPLARQAVTRKGKAHCCYKSHIDDEKLINSAKNFVRMSDFCDSFDFSPTEFTKPQYARQFVRRRLKLNGFDSWKTFKEKTKTVNNHKVQSIVFDGCEDVYDLEVDVWHNFAVGNNIEGSYIYVHNSQETCSMGEYGEILKIESNNIDIKDALNRLFYDTLNIEFNLTAWVRSLCKYGDHMLLLDHHPNYGVVNVFPMPVNEVVREEGFDKEHPTRYHYRWENQGAKKIIEPWQVAHFRLLGNDHFLPYGMSVLEPARRAWRQLILMEDAVMVYRIVRSPERRVFYIDVGNVAPNDIPALMEQTKNNLKGAQVVDPSSGRVDIRYNALSSADDYFIGVRGSDTGTRIESLPGGNFPIRKDSIIPLLDGRKITIEQLAKEYEEGKVNWVYSVQDKTQEIVAGKVAWCGKNYTCDQIHRVWLDDDTYVDMAPEHPLIMRDGSNKKASEVQPGESVMPFRTKQSSNLSYTMVQSPNDGHYKFVNKSQSESLEWKQYLNKKGTSSAQLKVKQIEILQNVSDDVYCMTVIGSKDEDDRHNFAVISKCSKGDLNVRFSGLYLANTGDIEDLQYIQNKLFAALKVPKSYLGYEGDVGGKSVLCISLETKIPLLDGRTLTLKDIIKEYQEGKVNYAYSMDTDRKRIIHGHIKWAGVTQKNVSVIRIWLDNDNYLDCTENHSILCRDGQLRQAHELKVGDSLMPLYKRSGMKNYEQVYHPGDDSWEFTHRAVSLSSNKYIQGKVIHHVDFDKFNNNPENLDCSMTWFEHRQFHRDHLESTLLRPDVIEQRAKDYKDPSSAWSKWIKSDEHRKQSSEFMKAQMQLPDNPFKAFLLSDQNKKMASANITKAWQRPEYREQRTQQNRARWDDPAFKQKMSGQNHWSRKKNAQYDFQWLVDFCKTNNITQQKDFLKNAPIGSTAVTSLLKRNGINGWRSFSAQHLTYNHKITKIEHLTDKQDVGCLTIDNKFHNFATVDIFIQNSQQDVRFSRTIQQIQRVVLAELSKIAMVHLYSMGLRDEELLNFDLSMANPSTINEIQRLELWRSRFEVASLATGQEGVLDKDFIYRHIFKLSHDEVETIEEGRRKDKLFQMELDAMQPEIDDTGVPDPDDTGSVENTSAPLDDNGVGESRDPNVQRAIPNYMLGKAKKKKKSVMPPSLKNQVYNLKKNGMDPTKELQISRRDAKAPFAEQDLMKDDPIFEKRINMMGQYTELVKALQNIGNSQKNKKIL